MREIWKPIPGFSYYEVSSHGRLRSLDRPQEYVVHGAIAFRIQKGRIIRLGKTKGGYHTILTDDEGARHTIKIHRLVAEAFLGKAPKGKDIVMHKDDDVANNHKSNLKWGSHSDNMLDRNSKNRQANSQRHGNAVLTDKQVLRIASLLKKGVMHKVIAAKYSCATSTIAAISRGATWFHVTGIKPIYQRSL